MIKIDKNEYFCILKTIYSLQTFIKMCFYLMIKSTLQF